MENKDLRQILAILAKEIKILTRDRQALALLFAMPAFFILVMSYALEGVFEGGSSSRPVEVAVINLDRGGLSREVISDLKGLEGIVLAEALDGVPMTQERAEELVRQGQYSLALSIPEGFSEKILSLSQDPAGRVAVTFIYDPATNIRLLSGIRGTLQGAILRRTLLATAPARFKKALASVMGPFAAFAGPDSKNMERQIDELLAKANKGGENEPEVKFLSRSPRGHASGRFPSATEQNVPAYTIFGVFFIVLTLASSFIQEKKEGTFQRILSAPLSQATLLIGKLLPYYLVNLIQIILMFAVGVVFFRLKVGDPAALMIVSLSLALAANGLGLLVASLARTEAQVNGYSVFLAIILSALGGMLVPAYIMPPFMKTLSLFTPHAWALAGYQDVIVRGLGAGEVLPEAGVLLFFAGIFFTFAWWKFRFR
jgi:ABC-2 type transport system permease protein